MSHFAVMVVTDTTDEIMTALQPYHEYECTGIEDEYVVFVDHTEEVKKEFEEGTTNRYRSPDGTIYEGYEDIFYRDPTEEEAKEIGPFAGSGFGHGLSWSSKDWKDGKGYRTKVHFIPSGFEKFEDGYANKYGTIEKYAEDYHGYTVNEKGEIGCFTNPNCKWDWWEIGGRYSGLLRTKPGADSFKGEAGLMGTQADSKGVDQCRVRDLDIEGMRRARQERIRAVRTETFEKVLKKCKEKLPEGADFMLKPDAFEQWDALSEQAGDAEKHLRALWETKEKKGRFCEFIDAEKAKGCPRATTLRLAGELGYGDWNGIDIGQTMQQAIDSVPPICTFAVLMDGNWYQRGEMGWWACISNEDEEWDSKFKELFENLQEDKLITIVDCHI